MNADEFARLCRAEKDTMVQMYFDPSSESAVGSLIQSLDLPQQSEVLRQIVDTALTDAFYTLLLGLDGEASLGGVQQPYQLLDESGSAGFGCGELVSAAYRHFRM